MNFYDITIAGLKRKLPLCRVNDDLYIAAFVIFGDASLTVASAKSLLIKAPEYDYIITAESKGIPLAHEMARQHGDDYYFLARKSPKLYMTGLFDVEVKSITTDHVQHLYLDKADAERMKNRRILLIDDVISTGESIYAIDQLVKKAGGIVAGKMCILAEGDAAKRSDITYLEPLPVFNPDGSAK